MQKREGSFVARDAEGNEYTIYIYCAQIDVTTGHSPHREYADGMRELRTEDGRAVNRIARGTYEIVGPVAVRVSSDDPAAP